MIVTVLLHLVTQLFHPPLLHNVHIHTIVTVTCRSFTQLRHTQVLHTQLFYTHAQLCHTHTTLSHTQLLSHTRTQTNLSHNIFTYSLSHRGSFTHSVFHHLPYLACLSYHTSKSVLCLGLSGPLSQNNCRKSPLLILVLIGGQCVNHQTKWPMASSLQHVRFLDST